MPIIIPPFTPYQAPLIPIRGLWNNPPPEGDRFIPVEIDWGVTTGIGMAVQIAITAFSPVEFSQIVALNVDNGRNGADVDFLFADTGRQLTVPAYCQGLFPVISNAMSFYVVSTGAATGDITVFEICNSLPPPIAIQPSEEQSHAAVPNLDLHTNGSTVLVPAGTTGTVQSFTLAIAGAATTAGAAGFQLVDGTGAVLYTQTIAIPNGSSNQTVPVTGVRLRFINGLNAVIGSSNVPAASANVAINLYYSVP